MGLWEDVNSNHFCPFRGVHPSFPRGILPSIFMGMEHKTQFPIDKVMVPHRVIKLPSVEGEMPLSWSAFPSL